MIRHEVVGLLYTRRCPLACRHCITESSPAATGKMRLGQAKLYLTTLARFTDWVSFTGGEPLLYQKEILELAVHARALHLKITVVTGAGWVKDEQTTHRTVSALAEAGVTRMTISWDRYHEECSRRERAMLLARLAAAAGIEVRINIVVPANQQCDHYRAVFAGASVDVIPMQLIRLGRARTRPADEFDWTEAPPKGCCRAVLKALIDYDGTVYACCGPSLHSARTSPLVLGNAEEEPLDAILDRAAQDPILEVISLLGPYGLYHLLQNQPPGCESFRPRERYAGPCELCLDITNSPELVAAVRSRLQDLDAQALLAAARMWSDHHKPAVA